MANFSEGHNACLETIPELATFNLESSSEGVFCAPRGLEPTHLLPPGRYENLIDRTTKLEVGNLITISNESGKINYGLSVAKCCYGVQKSFVALYQPINSIKLFVAASLTRYFFFLSWLVFFDREIRYQKLSPATVDKLKRICLLIHSIN